MSVTMTDLQAADRAEGLRNQLARAGAWAKGHKAREHRKVAQRLIGEYGGFTIAHGSIWDWKVKSVGLGFYDVWAEERHPDNSHQTSKG